MSKVLIIAEHRDGKLKGPTLELVSHAKKNAHDVHVLLLGKGVSSLCDELGRFGADSIHVGEHERLEKYTGEAYAKVASEFIRSESPDIVLGSHTPTGRDLFPRLAAQLNVGLASDCVELKFEGNSISVVRPAFAGKALCEIEFLGAGPRLATLRPNSLGTPEEHGCTPKTNSLTVALAELKTTHAETTQASSGRPDVTEASIVVSGGRSLKSADNFNILEDLADVLGAAVGASRAAVDAGYRPHRDQVGQTGKVVSPQVYMAFGISGAIQHLAGMRTSKVIVAVNTDPDAPIFQVADYGVVADLFEFVPKLTEALKAIR